MSNVKEKMLRVKSLSQEKSLLEKEIKNIIKPYAEEYNKTLYDLQMGIVKKYGYYRCSYDDFGNVILFNDKKKLFMDFDCDEGYIDNIDSGKDYFKVRLSYVYGDTEDSWTIKIPFNLDDKNKFI